MTTDNAVLNIYEDTLQKLIAMAREYFRDDSFGADIEALAKMDSIPGVPDVLENEILHFARAVIRLRNRKQ